MTISSSTPALEVGMISKESAVMQGELFTACDWTTSNYLREQRKKQRTAKCVCKTDIQENWIRKRKQKNDERKRFLTSSPSSQQLGSQE
jgi:hypothetical protein